jgi:YHS domain-containing protein
MKKLVKPLLMIVALACPMAIAAATKSADDAINKKCPITGKDVVAGRTSEYKKQTIGFCCMDCVNKFESEPEKWIKKVKEFKKSSVE